jgi:hypothetical protein
MKMNSFLELLTGHMAQSRIDMLGDAAEGAYGWRNIHFAPSLLQKLYDNRRHSVVSRRAMDCASVGEDTVSSGHDKNLEESRTTVPSVIRKARTYAAATYWIEFERESYGMWNLYGRAGESVAVETTVGALRRVLGRADAQLRVERMRYDPMRGEISDLHELFFHKRREYQDEREIRSVQVFDGPLKDPI